MNKMFVLVLLATSISACTKGSNPASDESTASSPSPQIESAKAPKLESATNTPQLGTKYSYDFDLKVFDGLSGGNFTIEDTHNGQLFAIENGISQTILVQEISGKSAVQGAKLEVKSIPAVPGRRRAYNGYEERDWFLIRSSVTDSGLMATGTRYQILNVWNIKSGKILWTKAMDNYNGKILGIAVSTDGEKVVACAAKSADKGRVGCTLYNLKIGMYTDLVVSPDLYLGSDSPHTYSTEIYPFQTIGFTPDSKFISLKLLNKDKRPRYTAYFDAESGASIDFGWDSPTWSYQSNTMIAGISFQSSDGMLISKTNENQTWQSLDIATKKFVPISATSGLCSMEFRQSGDCEIPAKEENIICQERRLGFVLTKCNLRTGVSTEVVNLSLPVFPQKDLMVSPHLVASFLNRNLFIFMAINRVGLFESDHIHSNGRDNTRTIGYTKILNGKNEIQALDGYEFVGASADGRKILLLHTTEVDTHGTLRTQPEIWSLK